MDKAKSRTSESDSKISSTVQRLFGGALDPWKRAPPDGASDGARDGEHDAACDWTRHTTKTTTTSILIGVIME